MAINIILPALSPTMETGTLAHWLKKEGDKVVAGDVIAEIETDKATMEVESPGDGVIGRILVDDATQDIPVNTIIGVILEEGETIDDIDLSEDNKNEGDKVQKDVKNVSVNEAKSQKLGKKDKKDRIFISPLARRIALEKKVDITQIKGTGPAGRILRRDIDAAEDAGKGTLGNIQDKDDVSNKVTHIPNSSIRRVIAKRLTESKTQIPHFYVSMDIELDELLKLRKNLNQTLEDENIKISVNDMMIKAVALALKKTPGLNVQYTEKELLSFEDVDISVAVSIPDGLITPIIRQADKKSLKTISIEAKSLIKRAREGKLSPEEFQGGTFSISNMGMFGVKEFSAIINPPQAAILAISAGEKRPVIKNDEISIATVMTATLSVDHRAVDGALGAQWLSTLSGIIQNPFSLVV